MLASLVRGGRSTTTFHQGACPNAQAQNGFEPPTIRWRSSRSLVILLPLVLGQIQGRQRQAQMMHAMTPVEYLDHSSRVQFHLGDHPIQPRPDPSRAVGREAHQLGPRGTQPVQMKRHQFDQRIRPSQRAVNDRSTSLDHPPFLIGLEENDRLGLAPLDLELLPFHRAADANVLDYGPHPDSAAIDPDRDPLASEFVTPRQIPGTEPEQVAGASCQHLGPQFTGDSPHCFLVQFQTMPSQLGARLLDRQQTDQAAYFGLDVGAGPFADPIGRQFWVETTALGASPLAVASPRSAVQRHHRDRHAPPKADHQEASFFSTGRRGTSAEPSTASTWAAISGHSLALARSPATYRSACRRAWS